MCLSEHMVTPRQVSPEVEQTGAQHVLQRGRSVYMSSVTGWLNNPDHQGAPVTQPVYTRPVRPWGSLNSTKPAELFLNNGKLSNVCIALWAISSGSPPLIRIPF